MSRRRELDELLGPCPLERAPFSEQLASHVFSEEEGRIHGFALQGDLARHYGMAEMLLLSLSGELPARERARAAEVALISFSGLSAGEAPAHSTIAARVIGADSAAQIGIAAVGLAEQAQAWVARAAPLLEWIESGAVSPLPEGCGPEEARSKALRHDLEVEGIDVPVLSAGLNAEAAVIAALHWAGLRRPEQLHAALVVARLPCVLGEAHSHAQRDLLAYPMNLPRFDYEGRS